MERRVVPDKRAVVKSIERRNERDENENRGGGGAPKTAILPLKESDEKRRQKDARDETNRRPARRRPLW